MLDWLIPDSYDGLHLCSVCGDRETRDDVCWVCRQQAMIDESVPVDSPDRDRQDRDEADDYYNT
jgi:hypothetical protein